MGIMLSTGYFSLGNKPEAVIVQNIVTEPVYSTSPETSKYTKGMDANVFYHDTDGDGEEENILIYNCDLCNAPPRELAIIDNGELAFFFEGGNLEFTPLAPGSFSITEANIPRDGRTIITTYKFSTDIKKYETINQYTKNPND